MISDYIKSLEHKLNVRLFFFLLKLFSRCKSCCDGYFYPQHGIAPHNHECGTTSFESRKDWPITFVPTTPEATEGVYYCPKCKKDMPVHIVGVTMGWGLDPQLAFSDGSVLYKSSLDKEFYPEYFKDGEDWPIDPRTGEKLPIFKGKEGLKG